MTEAARILVVDDDLSVAQSLDALLKQRGHETRACGSLSEALTFLTPESAWDIALLDVRLEEDDGRHLVDHIVSTGLDTACLMISGENSIDTAVDALRRGARDYIRKPFSPEELFHRVDAALDALRLKRHNGRMQRRLHESENLHRFLVNSSPDLVFMLSEDGRFTYLSDRLIQDLHFGKESLLGRPFRELAVPDSGARAEHLLNRIEESGGSHNTELMLRCGDDGGEPRSYQVILTPLAGETPLGDTGYFGVARDLTEQKQAEALITFQATHDTLTRLPNRALFQDLAGSAIRLARRDEHGCAVLYIDIDRFKGINDTLGHAVGDQLLCDVAARMRKTLRDSDTLSRVGGDEFLVLLPHVDNEQQCEVVAKKVCAAVRQPFHIEGNDLHVSASIGMAMFPEHGTALDEIIRHADIAMYAVKQASRDGFRMFSPELGEVSSHRFLIEQQLRNALQNNELCLHYQPQIDTESGNMDCLEALVRWEHPVLGLLYPGDFVSVAEECGLICDVDRWVVEQACRDLRSWADEGATDMRVAVNFSAQQFASDDMVAFVLATLERYQLRGDQLEVEITETDILRDLQSVTEKLLLLAEHGIRVALDDFGVGYTSLNYIRNLPVHKVKIDRSFVRDLSAGTVDGSIVQAIVRMAKGMNLQSVAEGVENREQVQFLTSIGCAGMQGYYFGHPSPDVDTRALLRAPVAGTA